MRIMPSFAIASVLSLAFVWPNNAIPSPRPAKADAVYIRPGADGKSWAIGNTLVERQVSFTHERGLETTSWLHKVTGTQFLKLPTQETPNSSLYAAEFSFQADGQLYAGSSPVFNLFRAETAREVPGGGRILEVKLLARQKPIEVSVFYAVYPGHPVIRKWIAVTNRGERPVTLSNCAFEAVPIEAALPSQQLVSAYYGIAPRESFLTGRAEDPAIVVVNPRTREGFLVMNEAPGWMKRTETNGWAEGIRVLYDTDIFPFERTVRPGETFTSAKSGIAFFQEGHGFSDPHWVLPFYTSQILMKKGSSYHPRWFYNTWEPFFQDYNETIVRAGGGGGADGLRSGTDRQPAVHSRRHGGGGLCQLADARLFTGDGSAAGGRSDAASGRPVSACCFRRSARWRSARSIRNSAPKAPPC